MLYFAIAERVGAWTSVRHMLQCLDSRELAEWQIIMQQDYWRERIAESMETPQMQKAKLKALLTSAESK